MKIDFENDTAARTFYEALSKTARHGGHTESTTRFDIVVLQHNRTVKEGENYAFNEAVRKCDTNQDGRITEMEARIFAEQQRH